MSDATGTSPVRNLLSGLMRAPLRFPVPLACAAAWAAITIAHQHRFDELPRTIAEAWQVFLISGLFLSLAATLFAEGRGWNRLRSLGLAGAALVPPALAVFVNGGNSAWESPGFYLLVPGGILLAIVAPFLRRGATDRAIWDFNLTSWLSVLFGLIVAIGLTLGTMGVLGGLEVLFDLSIAGKIYEDVWIVCLSVIWPWQTLAGIPGECDAPTDAAPPRWTEYVASWLLVPLAIVYMLLLYGFAAKVLVSWELPRGTVGWLCGGFVAFGLAVWSAAWPFGESGNRTTRVYQRYLHYGLIVPVILLAVAIGARIAEYGITEKRYALTLLALWLCGIVIYGIVARPARLAVAPASLAALLILGSLGPWGATAVSLRSQLGELESLLAEAGILVEGRIKPDQGLADQKQVRRITDIVDYMRRSGKLEDLNAWLAEAGASPGRDEDNQALLAHMGLDYAEPISWSVGEYETIDVAGFEAAHHLPLGADVKDTITAAGSGRRYEARFDGKILTVALVGRPDARAVFNLDALAERLRAMEIKWGDPASRAAMTLEAGENGLRARLHVAYMGGQRTPNGNEIYSGQALLLLGRRE